MGDSSIEIELEEKGTVDRIEFTGEEEFSDFPSPRVSFWSNFRSSKYFSSKTLFGAFVLLLIISVIITVSVLAIYTYIVGENDSQFEQQTFTYQHAAVAADNANVNTYLFFGDDIIGEKG